MGNDNEMEYSMITDEERKNERMDRERAELKQENAALKAELDDWKGNAEGFEPDAYMRLPVDADGVPIHIGDTVYAHDGSEFRVRGITVNNAGFAVFVNKSDGFSPYMKPERLSHRAPELPDSWEKLLGDLDRAANGETDEAECRYADSVGRPCTFCEYEGRTDCTDRIFADIADRIRTLREVR